MAVNELFEIERDGEVSKRKVLSAVRRSARTQKIAPFGQTKRGGGNPWSSRRTNRKVGRKKRENLD